MTTLPVPVAPRGSDDGHDLELLKEIWAPPRGWGFFKVVNNNYIGILYISTAILFLVLGGILALIMRAQLAIPNAGLVDEATYNQIFTMHGTVMMFLFAVPVVEAMAVYLLPGMLAARDLPFPRLSAYAYWAYAIGGIVFFCSIFFGLAPDGGWFMYTPLTSYQFSPSSNADFWLLGIGFIEISAIAGAIELIVGILRTRAPGMTLNRMPIYAWAMLVVGVMIVFGFPPVIIGTMLLEIERSFHWPFFIAEKGGDPVLWQHLFWLFGHPEVYIIFLPAAGMVSMILPTMVRTPLVGYRWVVLALVGTGFLSFALWVHHMFTVGIPQISLSFFSAASMAVAVPTGIQIFAWIATLWGGRPQIRVPLLFLLGFFFIFTLGGLTGVMVAAVPFDWQVHDTYFVVAHLHYVLIGGMLFPLFAGFYYWAPSVSGKVLSERVGRWVFGLMFVGFNVTFFPMHFTGLLGMPRRVYTYPENFGWDWLNLTSSAGSVMLAAGIALFLFQAISQIRLAGRVDVNPWGAGTLEWLPLDDYAARSIPHVTSREPLWDNPGLREEVERGEHYLPRSATGERETIVTSAVEAKPQYVMLMPGPSWKHVIAAVGTAGFFLLLTVKLVLPAIIFGVVAIAAIIAWLWETDRGYVYRPVDIGRGIRLPVYETGRVSHSWWAMIVLICVESTAFASLIFSYFYIWTITPGPWPPAGADLPAVGWPGLAAALFAVSSAFIAAAGRSLERSWGFSLWMLLAIAATLAAMGAEIWGLWDGGLRPGTNAFGALTYTLFAWQGFHVAVLTIMGAYTIARRSAGLISLERRLTYDNTKLLWHYGTLQALAALATAHLFPLATVGQ